MAIKGEKVKPAVQENVAPPSAEGEAPAKKTRGPRGPAYDWSRERDAALNEVLLSTPGLGAIKTAASVAAALASRPEFAGNPPTPTNVKTHINFLVKRYERLIELGKRTKGVPEQLRLDSARATVANLDVFDSEEEGE